PASPVSQEKLKELPTDVMWSDDDAPALRRAGEILKPRVKDILDVWYDFIGSTPHLVSTFLGSDGEPDADYLERVRGRFEQWVVDICTREFDDQWLAYQEEIALRHHTTKKNETDKVDSGTLCADEPHDGAGGTGDSDNPGLPCRRRFGSGRHRCHASGLVQSSNRNAGSMVTAICRRSLVKESAHDQICSYQPCHRAGRKRIQASHRRRTQIGHRNSRR